MSSENLYGAYGHIAQTVAQEASKATYASVYIGTAPINLIRGWADMGLVNEPVKLSNITAKNTVGYSNNWDAFTLSEVISAHFDNAKGNIGPVYVINILDPAVNKKEEAEHTITFVNGEAKITSDTIIIDSFAMEGKVEGTDYELSYNFTTGKLTVKSVGAVALDGQVSCTYEEVDLSKVTDAVFQGSKKDGVYKGAYVLNKLYPVYGIVPRYVGAPGFAEKPENYKFLCELCYQINKHWFAFAYADIPIKYDNQEIDTIDKVKTFREENGYYEANSKIYWPMTKINGKGIYHASTLAIVEKMREDLSKPGNHPCGTDGNKTVPVSTLYLGEDKERVFDQEDGNELDADGISTIIAWGGVFRLWGDHTATYTDAQKDVLDKRVIFDVNVIMLNYTLNYFQEHYGNLIDENIQKSTIQTITHNFTEWLSSLVADGALVGTPQVMFLEENNSTDQMTKGRFVWNMFQTNAPLLKAAECYASYTDAGISEFFEEEE